MVKAQGSFELTSWEEETYEDMGGGAKLTSASVTQAFEGDIEGKGAVRWLMAYRTDGTAHFVGLQQLSGTIGGRQGTVVLETAGDFDGKMATWEASVIRGSANGDLEGLTGQGSFGAQHGPHATFELEYELK